MASIELKNVTKKFGDVTALDDISLEIKDKEFFVLFGPAGAGKTTILNCIAGIMIPEEGIVEFDGEVMNLVDAAHRDTAMVFENYALYPQMSVYDNMASPLRSKLYKKDEDYIKQKVQSVAEMMKMENLLERLPSQLSNGQKQRVAMGRALVRSPRVYLMDEPLAHLDAKLRNSMRTELKEIQANFGTTSVYVTHDFMEALSLGDRIAVIKEGKVVQIGPGDEIYYLPRNEFVAQLMGDPEINIMASTLTKTDAGYKIALGSGKDTYDLPTDQDLFDKFDELQIEKADMAIRPQHLKYYFEPKEGALACTIYGYESIGNKAVITAEYNGQFLRMIAPNGLVVRPDQDIYVELGLNQLLFFDSETKEFIARYNESEIRSFATQED